MANRTARQFLDLGALFLSATLVGALPHVIAQEASSGQALQATKSSSALSVPEKEMNGRLIKSVRPEYPFAAKVGHIASTVKVTLLVSKTGAATPLELIAGQPIFQHAVFDSIKQWQYKPYLINGKPMDVKTEATITFQFGENGVVFPEPTK